MDSGPGYTLAHPVYLDVPMMISFLAALEGGVAVSGDETTTAVGSRERMLSARTGLRARLFGIVDADAAADASTNKRDETSFVSQSQRHHTSASLFNVLYGYLREDEQILDLASVDDLDGLEPGQLVEFNADYLGNPLEDILAFFGSLKPYIMPDPPPAQPATAASKRSGNPAKKTAAATRQSANASEDNDGLKILEIMRSDIEAAPVHDLLFSAGDGLEAVVTVLSEFYNETTKENLRQGRYRVVGKVTKVLIAGDSINLTRRTVMGAAGAEMAEQTIEGVRNGDDFSLKVANPIVHGPAVQVLPMSIFV